MAGCRWQGDHRPSRRTRAGDVETAGGCGAVGSSQPLPECGCDEAQMLAVYENFLKQCPSLPRAPVGTDTTGTRPRRPGAMATTHDKLITRKQAARLIGCTERTLPRPTARESDPLRPAQAGGAGKPTLFDPRAVADWWHRHELAKLQQAAGNDDPIDYHHERARLTKAQADYQE